jgi:hypothetical protein
MKNIKLLWLTILLVGLTMGATCKPGAQRTTYNTLGTTEVTVLAAVSAYSDLLIKGQIATNSVPAVAKAFNSFQQAYAASLAVAKFDTNGVVTPDLAAMAGNVITIINIAEGKKTP